MQTTLSEIESTLNLHPLTLLNSDLNDLAYLSSCHFLIGIAVNSIPGHDLSDVNEIIQYGDNA